MAEKILILGGTREASELAAKLVAEGHEVTTSLAGRTREPKPVEGKVRIGGFGGAEKLAAFLTANHFDRLVDATHPFAERISANAKMAAEMSGVALDTRARPPWEKAAGDNWIEVGSLEDARNSIPAGSRVLLALGSQHIELFKERKDIFFLIRMVDPPLSKPLLPNHELVLGTPSTDPDEEAGLLREHAITHVLCRNSGGKGAYAKIEAARKLGLPVIMVKRPDAT